MKTVFTFKSRDRKASFKRLLGLARSNTLFLLPVLSRIRSVGDAPTAYVCRRYACSLPVTDVKQLENLLDEATVPPAKSN